MDTRTTCDIPVLKPGYLIGESDLSEDADGSTGESKNANDEPEQMSTKDIRRYNAWLKLSKGGERDLEDERDELDDAEEEEREARKVRKANKAQKKVREEKKARREVKALEGHSAEEMALDDASAQKAARKLARKLTKAAESEETKAQDKAEKSRRDEKMKKAEDKKVDAVSRGLHAMDLDPQVRTKSKGRKRGAEDMEIDERAAKKHK